MSRPRAPDPAYPRPVAEHAEADIREYVLAQSPPGEVVKHAERVAVRHLYGRPHEVWDVWTSHGRRWWVITNPTNLYSQRDFRSLEVAFTYHAGLTIVLAHRDRPPVEDEEAFLAGTAWKRWQQAADALGTAMDAEDFQAVGLRCREALLGMVADLARPTMVPPLAERPKAGDFLGWSALIAAHVAPGSSRSRVRAHMTEVARTAWELVGWLTHSKTARRTESRVVVEAVSHVLTVYVLATLGRDLRARGKE